MLNLKKIKLAARLLRTSTSKARNSVLLEIASQILKNQKLILLKNQKDLNSLPPEANLAFKDRLMLNEARINQIVQGLKQVAAEEDPLKPDNQKKTTLKNGLVLKKVPSPIGVIFMIFESRPNVVIEAFSMGFKSGNAMILRGGKESKYTAGVFYQIIRASLKKHRLPEFCVAGITNPDRKIVNTLLTQKEYIDVVVPRGGENLINYVVDNSKIPIIKNDRGLCHIYIHNDANINMAIDITVNAKTQRPGVCNSAETILVNKKIAAKIIPQLYQALNDSGVKWYGCSDTKKILKGKIKLATTKNWNTEYLDLIINCKVVDGLDEAINHIEQYGSKHSECIITQSLKTAREFQNEVDAAVVYWNASTRFTDGFEFGFGGELGISTQKLHVRGPVGLKALTTERWVVDGKGQTRK